MRTGLLLVLTGVLLPVLQCDLLEGQAITIVRSGKRVDSSTAEKKSAKVVGMRQVLKFVWLNKSYKVWVIPQDAAAVKYTDPEKNAVGEALVCPKGTCDFTLSAIGPDKLQDGGLYVLVFQDTAGTIGTNTFNIRVVEFVGASLRVGIPVGLAIPLETGESDFASVAGVGFSVGLIPPKETWYFLSKIRLQAGFHRFAFSDSETDWAISVGVSIADKFSIGYGIPTRSGQPDFILLSGELANIVKAGTRN